MPNNRTLLIAIALTCFALIGGALYFQHVENMLPCPLCVIQRYAFLFAGIFALVAAFAKKTTPWIALSLASALGGVGTVAKHLYVLANPGFSCGIDPTETFLNKLPSATALPAVFRADGLCESAGDLVMGLSIPHWSAVWFAVVTAGLVLALVRRNK
jgi:disulfide bond formation protein DsbB